MLQIEMSFYIVANGVAATAESLKQKTNAYIFFVIDNIFFCVMVSWYIKGFICYLIIKTV